MPTLVSTGQLTIVDNNDARPITAFIAANGPAQQIYTKDESTVVYTPDWASTPLVLSAKVYVGGAGAATEGSANLSNRKWSTDLSTSLGTGTTYSINANLAAGSAPVTYYFEGDYTDPVTGLVNHVVASIVVSQVKTGTNAVYIQIRGQLTIEESTTSTKNTGRVVADLIRAAGVDNTGVTYRWFQSPHAAADQVDGNLASVTTKYGLQDTAAANANRVGAIGQLQTGSGTTTAGITTANVPDGGWIDAKALIINETAVTDMMVFKVEAKDSDGTIYQAFFTVYDVSDPYDTKLVSTSGDKLQNGVGSTDVYPDVYYGANKLTNLASWSFTWYFYDRNGNRGGFVDTTRTAQAGGRDITANTTGTSAVFTYSGTAITFAAGDIIKCVKPDGSACFFEVASGTGNTVTIRTPSTNTWLTFTTFPAPAATTDFAPGGKLFVCTAAGTRTTAGANNNALAAKITVTGDEIDAKGRIVCESNRP